MTDRGRDAGDIFTATIGKGSGVKARVGPANASLFLGQGERGIRNGALSRCAGEAETLSIELLLLGYEGVSLGDDRGKNFLAMNAFLFEFPDRNSVPGEFFTQAEVAFFLGYCRRF
jgi:hypothetical protein